MKAFIKPLAASLLLISFTATSQETNNKQESTDAKKALNSQAQAATADRKEEKDIYDNDTKLADDPTRIVTKLGFGGNYSMDTEKLDYQLNGSIGLGEAHMLNVRLHPETGEWSLGGSWLFDIGILNFYLSNNEYDDGSSQTSYSVGTFIPLSYFGIEPLGWQIFPMAGGNYTEGENLIQNDHPLYDPNNPYVYMPSDSTGGYLGGFALKPLSDEFTAISFAGYGLGSDDYSSYWFGAGLGYKITKKDSINTMVIVSDNNYGSEEKLILNYTHEF